MNWNEYYRQIAHTVKLKSKDIHTQIGAVIVGKGNQIISTGYNSFPRGIVDTIDERQQRPEKYYWFEHAERNAIYNAARNGVSTEGATIYLTCGVPCTDCARGIINAGITDIHCEVLLGTVDPRWEEHAKRSLVMFKEVGVKVHYYDLTPITDIEEFKKQPVYRPFVPLQWADADQWDKSV
jgi:dCMP deaminase